MVAALKLSHSVELEKVKRRLEEQQQAGDGADGAPGGASQEELAAAVEAKASLEAELEALRTEMRAVSAKAAKDELRVQRLSEEQNRRQSMEASELEAAQVRRRCCDLSCPPAAPRSHHFHHPPTSPSLSTPSPRLLFFVG